MVRSPASTAVFQAATNGSCSSPKAFRPCSTSQHWEYTQPSSAAGWPGDALEAVMAPIGKSLSFTAAESSELAGLQYNSPRTFAVLALLYPGLDLPQRFHEDHTFPRYRFTAAQPRRHHVPEELRADFAAAVNDLANLQLRQGLVNIENKNTWPWEWLASNAFLSEEARRHYAAQNDLDLLPDSIHGFLEFHAVPVTSSPDQAGRADHLRSRSSFQPWSAVKLAARQPTLLSRSAWRHWPE